ncbi:hypothetical protein RHMOL_Rhmol04G0021800 [Rhododendron molle]|uniref:Uncharacterized protein n=1 Tax=Rhododendron molle TaxID=49168 RepID=A0ACC0NWJ1_RHOML|nr:hypothetical protein RHMOL_Rhmol04G0021800 [Rhododendron molle]
MSIFCWDVLWLQLHDFNNGNCYLSGIDSSASTAQVRNIYLSDKYMVELDVQIPTTFDPFAEANDDSAASGTKGYVHIRIQQRNGRKSLTTVQGLKKEFSYEKILKDLKKEFCCNGTVVLDKELGKVIQLQGDQRKNVSNFLVQPDFVSVVRIPVGSDPLLRPCSLASFVRGIWGRSGRLGNLRSRAFLAHQAKPFLIFHACSDIRFSPKIKFGWDCEEGSDKVAWFLKHWAVVDCTSFSDGVNSCWCGFSLCWNKFVCLFSSLFY